MTRHHVHSRLRAFGLLAALFTLGLGACNDDDCGTFDPKNVGVFCVGGVGGSCNSDRDCEGECCEEKHCGKSGMCTFDCDSDRDCPLGTLCEHSVCLLACDGDFDCPSPMSCEHDRTVCEAK